MPEPQPSDETPEAEVQVEETADVRLKLEAPDAGSVPPGTVPTTAR